MTPLIIALAVALSAFVAWRVGRFLKEVDDK